KNSGKIVKTSTFIGLWSWVFGLCQNAKAKGRKPKTEFQKSSKPSGGSILINFFSTSTSTHIASANGIRKSLSPPSTKRFSVPPVRWTSRTVPTLDPSSVSTEHPSICQSKNSSSSSSTASDSRTQISVFRKVSAVSTESIPPNFKTRRPF